MPNIQNKSLKTTEILDSAGNEAIAQNPPQPFKCSIPIISTPFQARQVVVDKRNLTIELYDADKEDGDIVSLYTDTQSYLPVSLTKIGTKYTIDLGDKPGNRIIGVQNVASGTLSDSNGVPIATPGITIKWF